MASTTKKLKVRRTLRKVGVAKRRKNRLRRDGSTAPNLSLTVPNANELAMKQAAKK